jgi:hypothetical protein
VTRLIARRGLTYPADPESLQIVRDAGGFSQLDDFDIARVRVKSVEPGEPCDDIPTESLPLYLERGDVEVVDAELDQPSDDDIVTPVEE